MDVKDAVKESVQVMGGVFPSETINDLRLEEVQLSDDEATWSVTLSFRDPDKPENVEQPAMNGLEALFGTRRPKYRAYKVVRLRAADGMLLGIKDRD